MTSRSLAKTSLLFSNDVKIYIIMKTTNILAEIVKSEFPSATSPPRFLHVQEVSVPVLHLSEILVNPDPTDKKH